MTIRKVTSILILPLLFSSQVYASGFNDRLSVKNNGTLTNNAIIIGDGSTTIRAGSISSDATGTRLSIGPSNSAIVSLDVAGNFRTLPIALTDAATIATDASRGNIFTVTLAGNRTLAAPSNPSNGQRITYIISQDATGSRTLSYSPAFRFSTDVGSPTLSTAAGTQDRLGFEYNVRGTVARYLSWDSVAVVKGYAS